MPNTDLKVKSGKSYSVSYVVNGSLETLTRENLEALAIRQLRASARAFMVAKLNEAEPAILINSKMLMDMVEAGLTDMATATAFFKSKGLPLEIPSKFEIAIDELMPKESGRGKKAANIFSLTDEEGDDDEGDEEVTA